MPPRMQGAEAGKWWDSEWTRLLYHSSADQHSLLQTVLSGEVYTCMCFLIDMVNVSLELKDPKGKEGTGSLAR